LVNREGEGGEDKGINKQLRKMSYAGPPHLGMTVETTPKKAWV